MQYDISKVIHACGGPRKIARRVGVSHQAVLKWRKQGHLPRTEWTGETDYASALAELSDGRLSRADILAIRPSARAA